MGYGNEARIETVEQWQIIRFELRYVVLDICSRPIYWAS
jgi:hypothetical protein